MIVEEFKDAPAVYERFREKGRMLPDGVRYISSWPTSALSKCFQLMECDELSLIDEWIANWSDLTEFEVFEVITSDKAQQIAVEGQL